VGSLAALLRAGGLERFEGTLWVDGSLFAPEPYPEGWAHEDLVYSYAAPVNAVLANGNAVTLVATGGDRGVSLTLDPGGAPLELLGTPALGPPGSAPRLVVHRGLGSRILEVSGSIPPGGAARRPVAVPDPDSTAGLLLLGAMERAGIETKAAVRVLPARPEDAGKRRKDVTPFYAVPHGLAAPTSAVPWSAVRKDRAAVTLAVLTPPAREIAEAVNTYSLNTEAEALLRMLDPAPRWKRTEAGISELLRLAAEAGVDTMDLLLSDGSGLSRMNLATARAFVTWLAALDRDPAIGPPFRDGLSTPGGTGTLAHRGSTSIRGKTGTLRSVSALSGYVTAASGERIALSVLSNGTRGSVAPARAVEDELVHLLSRFRRDEPRPPRPVGIPR
jgi:D-alanyl-D-alanine carboxypeptidase/D-alanyl-D-alanine-endopeptidase (penicillin-binding protein 4)